MPESCNVLLVGGGGREHALAWKLRQSPRLGRLWRTDDVNPALAELAEHCPVELDVRRPFHLQRWCERESIHLVIAGPEAPLADGISDALTDAPKRFVFGPTAEGARIEADKAFAKELMRNAAVPTADARIFDREEAAREYIMAHDEPCVVKAAGLAAGKGVIVCETQAEALDALDRIMVQREFGDAGDRLIVEEKLTGREVSVLALVDGRTIWILDPAQDHKQVGEGDTGPNTGGMGAYCPAPVIDRETMAVVEREVFVPIVDAFRRDGIEYRGILYAGLMLTPGGPRVLEFNCRFGDPECQPLMSRLRGDLLEACWATATGQLDDIELTFDDRTACCVVLCAEGYPGSYRKGDVIEGLDEVAALAGPDESITVFHAGTKRVGDDIVTNGGRVIGVTALAADLTAARALANRAAETITWDGRFYRSDIGTREGSTAQA